jgi:hypothetical protein
MGKFHLLNKITEWFSFDYVIQKGNVRLIETGIDGHVEDFKSIDDVLKEFVPNMINCNRTSSFPIWTNEEIQFIRSL